MTLINPGGISVEWLGASGPEDFVSGRVLRDRYDEVLRPSFILLTNKSNLDPDQFFPGFFYSLKE
jgi:hypothetical protein